MIRPNFIFGLIILAGCSPPPDTEVITRSSTSEILEGGHVESADFKKVEMYFERLDNVESAKEEAELLTEFAGWLVTNGYKIRIEEKDGKHALSCPYFPPVTPWTDHAFFDVDNANLLPRLEDED